MVILNLLASMALGVALLAGRQVEACDCFFNNNCQKVAIAEFVAIVEIDASSTPDNFGQFIVEANIKDIQKGDFNNGDTVAFTNWDNDGECGVNLPVGTEWFVTLVSDGTGGLAVNSCSGLYIFQDPAEVFNTKVALSTIYECGYYVCSDSGGVLGGDLFGSEVACCPEECGTCGGVGCSTRGTDCCSSKIKASGIECNYEGNDAPCFVQG